VDILSNGRMKFGAGRAYQPAEFAGLGVPMERSREIFSECMDIIELAWAQDEVEYNGSYFQIPRTPVLPKPIQKRPPVYMAAVTAPSFEMAIRKGWNMQLATPFSYRLYRHAWLDEVEKSVQTVNEGIRARGADPDAIERALVLPFYVAPTKERARAEFEEHLEWFYNRVTDLSSTKAVGGPEKVVAGYEQSMREAARTQELDLLRYDHLVDADAVVCGDPDYCVERLREIRDRLGITEFMCFTSLGGLPLDRLHASLRLAAAEVLPHV
jgi:alkanesulfonate monooxygenase SsuD/methylene tetrahydromethanopterin reductase-like flavin-dependent oxidoreductase (luciferase family)